MATMNGQEDALNSLIAAKQLKQALNLCEKKLKKTPESDYLLLKKIGILLLWADPARSQQGLRELEALLDRKPPVADIEALHVLDIALETAESMKQLTLKQKQTWQRAVVSRPRDENLHFVWHRTKFRSGDFKGAQQAAMTWMKNFPQERKPFFLYIMNTHIVAETTNDEREKSLMQNLAHRFLSQAAAEVTEANRVTTTAKREIQTFQDRCLLLRVYRAQGRFQEAVDMIENPLLGMASQAENQKWELVRQYLDLLEEQKRWPELLSRCQTILNGCKEEEKSEPLYQYGKLGDDWKIWRLAVYANSKHNPIENSTDLEEWIESFFNRAALSNDRNARLALLLFHAVEVMENRENQYELVDALIDYFEDHCHKLNCFFDLKDSLPSIDIAGQKRLLRETARMARDKRPRSESPDSSVIFWITSEINYLKLQYHLVVSQDWNSKHVDLLDAFVCRCLQVYGESLQFGFDLPVSDRRPGDDAALLAVMGLVRLFKTGRRHALLQAVVVLEHTLLHSKHNYDALLILVRLYMFLGAGSLAMNRYDMLSIKNIQQATISWVLFTRLSTIHPYASANPTNGKAQTAFVPFDAASHAYLWHKSAQDLSQKAMLSFQGNGQWCLSLDSLETNSALSSGFARCLFYVEAKRIERFSSSKSAFNHYQGNKKPFVLVGNFLTDFLLEKPPCIRDSRDRSAFPDFEGGELTFEQHLPVAGTSADPNDAWIATELHLSYFWDILEKSKGDIVPTEIRIEGNSSASRMAAFTSAEHGTSNIVFALIEFHNLFSSPEQYERPASIEFIHQLVTGLENWVTQCSERIESSIESGSYSSIPLAPDLKIPMWNQYHELFSHLEQCKFIIATFENSVAPNKRVRLIDHTWLSSRAEMLRIQCEKLSNACQRSANALQDRIFRDQEFLRRLNELVIGRANGEETDDPIGKELSELGQQYAVRKVCQDLRDSWDDGLRGIVQTKIP